MSMAFSSPNRVNAATAQKENRVSTSPHLSPESIGHTHILFLRSLKCLLEKILFSFVQKAWYQIYNANSISIIWKNNFGKSQKVQFYNFSKLSWFMYKNGLIWKLTWHFFCHIIFLAKLQFYRIQFSIFWLYRIFFLIALQNWTKTIIFVPTKLPSSCWSDLM